MGKNSKLPENVSQRTKHSKSVSPSNPPAAELISEVSEQYDLFVSNFNDWDNYDLVHDFLRDIVQRASRFPTDLLIKHLSVMTTFLANGSRELHELLTDPLFQSFLTHNPTMAKSYGFFSDKTSSPPVWRSNTYFVTDVDFSSESTGPRARSPLPRSPSPTDSISEENITSSPQHSTETLNSPAKSSSTLSAHEESLLFQKVMTQGLDLALHRLASPVATPTPDPIAPPTDTTVQPLAENALQLSDPLNPDSDKNDLSLSPVVEEQTTAGEAISAPDSKTSDSEPACSQENSKDDLPMDTSSTSTFRIIFMPVENNEVLMKSIHKIAPTFEAKLIGKFIHIFLYTHQDFTRTLQLLTEQGVSHRFNDPSLGKPVKFVLRGLPHSTSTDLISHSLTAVGLKPVSIAYMKNSKTRTPMPLFVVDLYPTEKIDETLSKLTSINHLPVSFKPFIRRKPPTCHRCQAYFHSSLTCRLPYRCVICSGPHPSKDCKVRGQPDKFKCCHCNGKHTANYSKCPKNPLLKDNNSNSNPTQPLAETSTSPLASNCWYERSRAAELDPSNTVSIEPDAQTPPSDSVSTEPRTLPSNSQSSAKHEDYPKPKAQKKTPRTKIQLDSNSINRRNASNSNYTAPQTDNSYPDPYSSNSPNIGYKKPDSCGFADFFSLLRELFNSNFIQKFRIHLSSILSICKDPSTDFYEKLALLTPILFDFFET